MFSSDREELRSVFFDAWERHQAKLPLEDTLQAKIVEIILLHPEYYPFLNDRKKYQGYDFENDNPFLHLSLHLALHEQIRLNRPAGVSNVYQRLMEKYQDDLIVEHMMLLCLTDILWEAQEKKMAPDEEKYLGMIQKLD